MKKITLVLLALLLTSVVLATITGKWVFTGSSVNAVIGGSSFNGSVTGSLSYDGTLGAYGFADGNYIVLPSAVCSAINGYSTYSLVAYMTQSAYVAGYQVENVFGQADNNGGDFDFAVYTTNGAPWTIRSSGATPGTWAPAGWPTTQTTYRINVEWDGTNRKIYKNGTQVGSGTSANGFETDDTLRLGRGYWPGDHLYTGSYLEKVYLVDSALSGAEPSEGTPTFTPTRTATHTASMTATATQTITPTSTSVIRAWTRATEHAAFGPRMFPASCVFKGKMWIIGGRVAEVAGPNLNDVWWSTNGVDWYAATRNAEFPARMRPSVYVKDNKMWIASGQTDALNSNDVWSSSDGVVWTQVVEHAAFAPRRGQMMGNITDDDGNIWILTGQDAVTIMPDAWYSNNGADWIAATRNAESGWRSGGAGAWFANKLWIVGGNGDLSTTNFHAWYSSNGIVWVEAGLVYDKQIQHNTLTVANNIMFSLTGSTQSGLGPAWDIVKFTYDGETWYDGPNGFGQRSAGASMYYNGKLWVMAGMDKDTNSSANILDDVWFAPLTGSNGRTKRIMYDGF